MNDNFVEILRKKFVEISIVNKCVCRRIETFSLSAPCGEQATAVCVQGALPVALKQHQSKSWHTEAVVQVHGNLD